MIFQVGTWFMSKHHREKRRSQRRLKCLTHSPHFPTTSSHSYLAIKTHLRWGLPCMIPHADYFCLPALHHILQPFSLLSFFRQVWVFVCVYLEQALLSCHFSCLLCGHMKETVPGCVYVHIYARKPACKHQGRDRSSGRDSLGHNKTQQHLCPKTSLAHILNCLYSCQSGLATSAGCQCETRCWIQTRSRRSREPHHLSLPR